MTVELEERLVVAFEKIAESLAGINETRQKEYKRDSPESRQYREAIVTRVPTEDDRAKEEQGASDTPILDWLTDIRDNEDTIGPREKEFLRTYARSKENPLGRSLDRRVDEAEGEAGDGTGSTTDHTDAEAS